MDKEELKLKLLSETAKISWQELERYFAKGVLYQVSANLDLVLVATEMASNERQQVDAWLQQDELCVVDMPQAKALSRSKHELWAVVVAPWVLVQEKNAE